MVQLTEAIIKSKTKLDKLAEVKNLNLWGQDITDVSILRRTPNVEILSLSVNGISSLKEFIHCKELKELYLRKNNVASLGDIRFLMPLANLKVLWLSDNPCAELPNYRQVVVANLPQLVKLDNVDITQADRDAAKGMALLQPATSAEVAAEELCSTGTAGAPDLFSVCADQQQQQPLETAVFGRAQTPPAVSAAVDPGYQSLTVGQAAVQGSEGYAYGATIGVTVPSRADATADAGVSRLSDYPYQQRQQPPYVPQRYSSYVPSSSPTGALVTDHPVQLQQQQVAGSSYQQQPQQTSIPMRAPGGRTPPGLGSPNVLYAVMALLADLDVSQLAIVQKEVEQRLASSKTT